MKRHTLWGLIQNMRHTFKLQQFDRYIITASLFITQLNDNFSSKFRNSPVEYPQFTLYVFSKQSSNSLLSVVQKFRLKRWEAHSLSGFYHKNLHIICILILNNTRHTILNSTLYDIHIKVIFSFAWSSNFLIIIGVLFILITCAKYEYHWIFFIHGHSFCITY